MQVTTHNCIQDFFNGIYNSPATETKDKVSTTYSLDKERPVNILLDKHGGCLVNIPAGAKLPANFKESFQALSLSLAKTGMINSIWLNFFGPATAEIFSAIPSSWSIDNPSKGQIIIDTQKKCTRIWQWLNPSKECNVPPGGTHNLGASAAVIDVISRVILLVQDKQRNTVWGMPGGSFDPALDSPGSMISTAIRECKEEASVDVSAEKGELIGQMQFPSNQFAPGINQIWRFPVDHSKFKPIPQPGETLQVKWITFADVMKGELEGLKIGPEVQAAIAAKTGLQLHEKSNQWMKLYTT